MSSVRDRDIDLSRLASRIEAGAPSAVLFSMAISVVLVTAGIIYVLVAKSVPFYQAFGCGADMFDPPDDWSEGVQSDIWGAANYSEGSITDPFYLDSLCIVDWDNESLIKLGEPLVVFERDRDSNGIPILDNNGDYTGNWTAHEKREYILNYLDNNPQHNYSQSDGEDIRDAYIPLGVLRENERALILHQVDTNLKRDWIVITWVGSERANLDIDDDGNPNLGVDERGTDLDSDIDDDGFDNFRDPDMDNDGIPNAHDPNPRVPNVDRFGLFLGVLTILAVLLNLFSPVWLSRFPSQQIDAAMPPLGSFSLVLVSVGSLAILYPLSQSTISYLLLVNVVLIGFLRFSSKKFPTGPIAMALALLWLSLEPTHEIQTGHLISFGLSLLLLRVTMSDTRNRTLKIKNIAVKEIKFNPVYSLKLKELNRVIIILFLGLLHPYLLLFAIIAHPLYDLRIFIGGYLSQTRTYIWTSQRMAYLDSDFRALLLVVTIVATVTSFFDLVARVDGSLGEFLTQTLWRTDIRTVSVVTVTDNLHIGVNALLQTTLQVALGALIIAIPLGLGTAIFLSEYASPRTANIVKPILEILAGIPSVVYGFFAFVVISPIVMDIGNLFVDWGWMAKDPQPFNPINGAVVVGIMITPLIASLSEDALRSVPNNLREASYALGATPVETTFKVVIPSGLSGILASIILAFSRAIGETMAVTLSVGTAAYYTKNMFISSQTMTAYIAKKIQGDLPAGTSAYYSMFAVGLYLFIITLGLNIVGQRIMHRFREEYE